MSMTNAEKQRRYWERRTVLKTEEYRQILEAAYHLGRADAEAMIPADDALRVIQDHAEALAAAVRIEPTEIHRKIARGDYLDERLTNYRANELRNYQEQTK